MEEKMEEKIKENYKDNNTKITYTLKGDYHIPNLYFKEEEKIILNKYGRARLRFLKEHKKAEYTIMFIDGVLNEHLKEIQETAQARVDIIVEQLKKKNNLQEELKNTEPLYWTGMMNNLKLEAEEIVYRELICV